ncbi:MAG TPA: phosphatidate cytidylyltransferase [Bacillota bacterium]|nr:phosphatidate cytidylyltransferase [Bacillota bacterium]
MLHLRILSALVGIPLILGLVYLGGSYYALFMLLVAILGIREYTALLKSKSYHLPTWVGYAGVALFMSMLFLGAVLERELILPALIIIMMSLGILQLIYFGKASLHELALILWGIIYLGGFGGYMILLRQLPQGLTYTRVLFVGVWANDTFAYFVGIKWGRKRLAPEISPKKSVEGACAAIAGTVLLATLVAYIYPSWMGLTPGKAALLGVGISVFAQLGDLLESALKRQFEVKDTGQLIPGHGGVLDRFDSLLFTAPMVYYFFILLG